MHINDSQATSLYEDRKRQLVMVFSTDKIPVFEWYSYNSKNSIFFTFPSGEMVVTNLLRSPEHEQELVTLAALGSNR
jgi:hypothetical protein